MPGQRLYRIFRSLRRTAIVALAAASVAVLPAPAAAHVQVHSAHADLALHRTIGAIDLHACGNGAYCGRLTRALDPGGEIPDEVSIHFEFYPHSRAGEAGGTLVATEGGPGYPATESRRDYLALFGPLRTDRDVVIMDNRGTGKSGAIDCHELQTGEKWTVDSVARCGAALGGRAALYSTEYAADDLAAVLDALGVRQIDLYGDSYGTYFEQVFALRHPGMLRSIVLDGAYPLTGPDYAWYPSYAPAMRDKFNLACRRSADCAALPGNSIDHIMPALQQLRTHPLPASGFDVDGKERRFQADASQLAIVMFGSAPPFTSLRETDAAARAYVRGDRLPLFRLMAETAAAVDSRDPSADAARWSAGLAAAVMCQDPPQIFDMSLPPAQRTADRDRAVAERRRSLPETYAPFTIDEYRAMPLDYSFLDQCVGWPVAPAGHPASQVGMHAAYPDVPALILSGEFDNITTMTDGAAVAAGFKRGVQIRIANSFHVNALPRARSACGAAIVRRFIVTHTVDDSCASRVPPLRLLPEFALQSAELAPATALSGNTAGGGLLRAAAAASFTAGDLLARINGNTSGRGVGLRGGSYRVARSGARVRLRLKEVRWVDDVAISGTIDESRHGAGAIRAALQVSARDGGRGRLTLKWPHGDDGGMVHINGSFGRFRLLAQSPVP